MQKLRRWLNRSQGRIGLAVVGLASIWALLLSHRTWRDTLEWSDSLHAALLTARVQLTHAYLIVAGAEVGDRTFDTGDAEGYLRQATAGVRSLVTPGSPIAVTDRELSALVDTLGMAVTAFRRSLATGVGSPGANHVDRRVAFAALERAFDGVRRRAETLRAERIAAQARRFEFMLGGWVAFLLVVGLTVHALTRSRMRADQSVRQNEERFRLLTTLAPVGIFRCALDGTCLDVNDRWLALTGLGVEEALQRRWFDAVHPEDRESVQTRWRDSMEQKGNFRSEFRFAAGSRGYIWVLGKASVVGEGVFGTVVDISDRKQIEAQLQQAQKLEAVGQLTGGIAHDFNNLLTIVSANAELVEEGMTAADPGLREAVGDIRQAASSGAELVRGLLGFSRRADLVVGDVELCAHTEDVARLVRRILPANIELRYSSPGVPVTVKADPGAVQQMLLNLVTNARDAMPEGGRLDIRVAKRTVDSHYVEEHPWVVPGTYGCLTVADTGQGMDEATRARVFEPFFSTKGPGRGTGLGLSMVYGLTKQQGGFIHLYSEKGQGSTFRVHLPIATGAPSTVAPGRVAATVGGTERVLLVEDQEELRRTGQRILEHLGYTVIPAADGDEALAMLAEARPDVILSDLVMPHRGGLELYHALKAQGDTTPFVFSSGYTSEDLEARARLPEDAGFLSKPWTLDELDQAIRQAVQG